MANPRPLIAGNWKMFGRVADMAEIATVAREAPALAEVVICPPATLLARAVEAATGRIAIGAQDCSEKPDGAHTGEVSATMLADIGAAYAIVGHSERRATHGEGDQLVGAKAAACLAAGLTPIVCVGETLAEREAGEAEGVVARQMAALSGGAVVLAYEPVWAIGTGLTPSGEDIAAMHAFIRAQWIDRFGASEGDALRILYGGSVKPANAAEILALAGVNGALVGGASLKAKDFLAIIAAVRVS